MLAPSRIIKFLKSLLFFRYLTIAVGAFTTLTMPHVWRQVDTLGVSYRYWLRWSSEGFNSNSFLPAVLNSGDAYRIIPMEFPIINILMAPCFVLGPYWGKVSAIMLLVSLLMILTHYTAKIWKGTKLQELDVSWIVYALPLFATSGKFFGKFMPDYTAMILVFLGLGLIVNRKAFILGIFVSALGMLIKPVSIVVFGFALLVDSKWYKSKFLFSFLAALVLPLLYYTVGLSFIRGFQDSSGLFAVEVRNPLDAFVGFFGNPLRILELLGDNLIFYGFPIFLFLVLYFRSSVLIWRVVVVLGLQILAIAFLDGSHSFTHDYYYIGTAPTSILLIFLVIAALNQLPLTSFFRTLRFLFGILFMTRFFEHCLTEVQNTWNPLKSEQLTSYKDCEILKNRHLDWPWGKNYIFQSPYREFPLLGLCFGERIESTTSSYGFALTSEVLPKGCSVIDKQGEVNLLTCSSPLHN